VIDLEEGMQPPFGPIYNLLQDEIVTLQKYIDANFKKGIISHSKFTFNALILFVKEKKGCLQMLLIPMG
jgi:hypothetical protein